MQLLFNSSIFFLFFLVSMKEDQMLYFIPFFLISIASQWALRNTQVKWIKLMFTILQFSILMGLLNFSGLQSFVLSLTFYLLYWDTHVKNFHKIWIALTALAYSALNHFSMPRVTEIALFILILILAVFVESKTVRVAFNRIGMIGTTILLSATAYIILPYSFKAIGWLLYVIVHIISLPIGYLVEGLLIAFPKLSIKSNGNESEELINMGKFNDFFREDTKSDDTVPIIILSILAIAILIFLYRKIRTRVEDTRSYQTVENNGFLQMTSLGSGNVNKAPNNPIRKAVYKWEKKMKDPFSRQRGEAFSKWIKRVSKTENEYLKQIYDRVRYGDQSFSAEETKKFQKELNQLFGEVKKGK